jgi:hypothetical protein
MRRGIHRWVIAASRDPGDKLQRLTPAGIAAFLVASAIAPIAQPLLNSGASGLATVLVGQFGAVGAGYLSELLMRTVDRLRDDQADQVTASEADLRDALAADLMEQLGDGDAQLTGEIAVVLASLVGIQLTLETAIEASADHMQELLVESFASLGGSFGVRPLWLGVWALLGRGHERSA